jgi:hypothetical protein
MKSFDRVLIITDGKSHADAEPLRAALESFNLTVHLHRLLRHSQAQAFFASDFGAGYSVVILCAHGMGNTPEQIRIEMPLLMQKNGDERAAAGWSYEPFVIRPADVPSLFASCCGHVISMACGGGRAPWGQALLDAGAATFTGYDDGTDDGPTWMAFHLFIVGVFYFLLTESVAKDRREHTLTEAVRLATKFDKGVAAFRIYER